MADDKSADSEDSNAKGRTIDELKAFEARKREAAISLRAKLADFAVSLSEAEKVELDPVLQIAEHLNSISPVGPSVSVFLKPMQVLQGEAKSDNTVFLKPMQILSSVDAQEASVFLKPMQILPDETARDVMVYLKPMQVRPGELEQEVSVYLKPMQVRGAELTVKMVPIEKVEPDEK